MGLSRKFAAEIFGTFWLVFGGCGSAVISAAFPEAGIGLMGVSLAFGLTVVTAAYAVGHISGGHFNPAVTIGLWAGGRFPTREILPYIVAQATGGTFAAYMLLSIASGNPDFDLVKNGLAVNGFGEASPGGFSMMAGLITETLLTAIFLIVILGATDKRSAAGFAPLAIGLALTLIHLISIPVTNTSVNPARSLGPALVVGGVALQQLWLFWLAPIVGAVAGSTIYRFVFADNPSNTVSASS